MTDVGSATAGAHVDSASSGADVGSATIGVDVDSATTGADIDSASTGADVNLQSVTMPTIQEPSTSVTTHHSTVQPLFQTASSKSFCYIKTSFSTQDVNNRNVNLHGSQLHMKI